MKKRWVETANPRGRVVDLESTHLVLDYLLYCGDDLYRRFLLRR